MLYSHIINIHIYTYTCRIHFDAILKTSEDFFKKIYFSLYLKGCVREEVGDWIKTATYWPSKPLRTSPCVLLVLLGCSTGGLGAKPLWNMFSFQHLLINWSGLQTNWLSVLTELYNSSIALTISLEWHVWSSSNGNNCHAVHRSLSCGASIYDYHGILPCPILSAKPTYAISSHNCHRNASLPLSLEWHFWPGRRSIYNKWSNRSICNNSL